jgi:hypothetical protein
MSNKADVLDEVPVEIEVRKFYYNAILTEDCLDAEEIHNYVNNNGNIDGYDLSKDSCFQKVIDKAKKIFPKLSFQFLKGCVPKLTTQFLYLNPFLNY